VIVFAQQSDYKSRDRKRVAQAAGLAFEMLYMPGQARCAEDRIEIVRRAVVHNGRGITTLPYKMAGLFHVSITEQQQETTSYRSLFISAMPHSLLRSRSRVMRDLGMFSEFVPWLLRDYVHHRVGGVVCACRSW
jgi:hypothetical protein